MLVLGWVIVDVSAGADVCVVVLGWVIVDVSSGADVCGGVGL